jgi:hypothetical protein
MKMPNSKKLINQIFWENIRRDYDGFKELLASINPKGKVTSLLLEMLEQQMLDPCSRDYLHSMLRDQFLASHRIIFPYATAIEFKGIGILVSDIEGGELAAEILEQKVPKINIIGFSPIVRRRFSRTRPRIYLDGEEDSIDMYYGLRCKNLIENDEIESIPLKYVVHFTYDGRTPRITECNSDLLIRNRMVDIGYPSVLDRKQLEAVDRIFKDIKGYHVSLPEFCRYTSNILQAGQIEVMDELIGHFR